jgi:hypothetical protein
MTWYRKLSKPAYWILCIATALSLLWFLVLFQGAVAKWPVSSYTMFIIWCLMLCAWSYRKLQNQILIVQAESDTHPWPSWMSGKKAPEYETTRTRHAYYFIVIASIWLIIFMGDEPHYDGEYEWMDDTVMAQLALKYFGVEFSYPEGHRQFEYFSKVHQAIFYSMNIIPLIILAVGGSKVYRMSEARLDAAKRDFEEANSR